VKILENKSALTIDRAISIDYNRGMENKAPHEIAMELSDGLFAWHLFGVLGACQGLQCPDLNEVALEYIQTKFPQKVLDPSPRS